ncbi:MAG: Ger(x)C family spore germination protein [Epulopiscium sp.]|nr:Ger(x)C family spore germination protein [Candidatus Epulonipiscium sp.]
MIRRSNHALWALLLVVFCTTGCWDKREIDDQQFVIALGIDKNKNAGQKSENNPERYRITYVTPSLSKATKDAGEDASERFIQVLTGETITGVTKKAIAYYLVPLSYEHVKVIIVGQELAEDKELFKETLDYLSRNPEFSRAIPIFITSQTAEGVLNTKIEGDSLRSRWIIRDRVSTGIPDELIVDLGQIFPEMSQHEGTTLITRIGTEEKSFKVSGAAVISEYLFQDWLDSQEVKMITWLRGKNSKGYISLLYKDVYVPYEVSNLSCKITSASFKNHLTIEAEIHTEGDVAEYILPSLQVDQKGEIITEKWIEDVEKELEKKIENDLVDIIKKIQREYKTDIFGFDDKLKLKYPGVWKEIKDDYKEIFSQAQIKVKVDLSIRRIGMTF